MAVNDKALFIYGMDVTQFNYKIPFVAELGGDELIAEMAIGNYTLTEFLIEMKRAMEVADADNTYTWGVVRTTSAGTSNRVSVSTSGSYLDLNFGSSPVAGNSPFSLIGFNGADYTGSTSYTGYTNAGTILIPDFPTYDYLPPDAYITNDGSKTVSSGGIKETLVFAQMQFMQGQWKYITDFNGNTQFTQWNNFMKYATRQLKFEIEPSINEDPEIFHQVTLESTPEDQNGMSFKMKQMRGQGLYRFYDTGLLKFRIVPS